MNTPSIKERRADRKKKKQQQKQTEKLQYLQQLKPDWNLPDSSVPALNIARLKLGRLPKGMRSHASIMANFDYVFRTLGTKPPKKKKIAKVRKPVLRNGLDVVSAGFLQSYEWRRLRYEALKKNGARCQCCGRGAVDGTVMNVDHIKPRAKHPELALEISNLQVLCNECNHGKGNWDETDWRNGRTENYEEGEKI